MGYRSDVTIVMYPKKEEDYAMLKLFVDENLPDKFEEHWHQQADEVFRYLLLELESIKWYGDYPEVAVYTSTFLDWEERFKDKDEPDTPLFHYEFMRVGEHMDDVEYDCSSYADRVIHVNREVYINF